MTIQEMHIEVGLGVQGLGPSRFDDFLPEEVDYALNKAQSRIVKQSYNYDSRLRPKGFEQSQKRIDDLKNLLKTAQVVPAIATSAYDYVKQASLPADYMFGVNFKGRIKHKNCKPLEDRISITNPTTEVSNLRFVQHDDIDDVLKDPFNTTKIDGPLYTMENDKIFIYESAIFIVDLVFITYLKTPVKMSLSLQVDCELSEHLHSEIVEEAVQILLSDTGNPRVQQKENDVSRSE
jgi:hypothetical protein